jgi:hypothetical protein
LRHVWIHWKNKYFFLLNKVYLILLIGFLFNKKYFWGLGIGDWGLGIGDWGLGPIPNPQSPIPNPQSPKIFFFKLKPFI